jgi:hypothetical protein
MGEDLVSARVGDLLTFLQRAVLPILGGGEGVTAMHGKGPAQAAGSNQGMGAHLAFIFVGLQDVGWPVAHSRHWRHPVAAAPPRYQGARRAW